MSRINTNVQSLIAQRVLGLNTNTLGQSLERLSTGLRISRGKDDPAGLIASENLRGDIKATNAAIANAERADQVVNIAEGGLQEVSSLLTELQGLVTANASSAGVSTEEKKANQLQVDSILQTIDRIASATNFQGIKLLNGNLSFTTSSVATSVTDYRINGAKFAQGGSLDVNVLVTTSAQQAGLYVSVGATSIDLGAGSSFVFEITGSQGSRELTFTSSNTLAQIVTAINSFKEVTGVSAIASGNGIKINSIEFGSNEFVSLKVIDDGGLDSGQRGIYQLNAGDADIAATTRTSTFSAATNGVKDEGQDIGASINGISATGSGKTARINTDFLDVEITLSTSGSQALGAVGSGRTLTITGGGADFQLAGKVDIGGRVSIGIQDVAARKLGTSSLGYLSSLANGKANDLIDGDKVAAQKVVTEAINQVSALRGRLGAFQKNVVGATIRSLGVAVENVSAAQSIIRDADFAAETANLTRAQILVAASTNVLGLANSAPQSVLQLLG